MASISIEDRCPDSIRSSNILVAYLSLRRSRFWRGWRSSSTGKGFLFPITGYAYWSSTGFGIRERNPERFQ